VILEKCRREKSKQGVCFLGEGLNAEQAEQTEENVLKLNQIARCILNYQFQTLLCLLYV